MYITYERNKTSVRGNSIKINEVCISWFMNRNGNIRINVELKSGKNYFRLWDFMVYTKCKILR
jgi:hypothetical protein